MIPFLVLAWIACGIPCALLAIKVERAYWPELARFSDFIIWGAIGVILGPAMSTALLFQWIYIQGHDL